MIQHSGRYCTGFPLQLCSAFQLLKKTFKPNFISFITSYSFVTTLPSCWFFDRGVSCVSALSGPWKCTSLKVLILWKVKKKKKNLQPYDWPVQGTFWRYVSSFSPLLETMPVWSRDFSMQLPHYAKYTFFRSTTLNRCHFRPVMQHSNPFRFTLPLKLVICCPKIKSMISNRVGKWALQWWQLFIGNMLYFHAHKLYSSTFLLQ